MKVLCAQHKTETLFVHTSIYCCLHQQLYHYLEAPGEHLILLYHRYPLYEYGVIVIQQQYCWLLYSDPTRTENKNAVMMCRQTKTSTELQSTSIFLLSNNSVFVHFCLYWCTLYCIDFCFLLHSTFFPILLCIPHDHLQASNVDDGRRPLSLSQDGVGVGFYFSVQQYEYLYTEQHNVFEVVFFWGVLDLEPCIVSKRLLCLVSCLLSLLALFLLFSFRCLVCLVLFTKVLPLLLYSYCSLFYEHSWV